MVHKWEMEAVMDYPDWQNLLSSTDSQTGSITGGSLNQSNTLKAISPTHQNYICQALH